MCRMLPWTATSPPACWWADAGVPGRRPPRPVPGAAPACHPAVREDGGAASENAGGQVGSESDHLQPGATHAGTFDDVARHTGDANVRVDNANGVNPVDELLYGIRTFNNDTSLHVTPG